MEDILGREDKSSDICKNSMSELMETIRIDGSCQCVTLGWNPPETVSVGDLIFEHFCNRSVAPWRRTDTTRHHMVFWRDTLESRYHMLASADTRRMMTTFRSKRTRIHNKEVFGILEAVMCYDIAGAIMQYVNNRGIQKVYEH